MKYIFSLILFLLYTNFCHAQFDSVELAMRVCDSINCADLGLKLQFQFISGPRSPNYIQWSYAYTDKDGVWHPHQYHELDSLYPKEYYSVSSLYETDSTISFRIMISSASLVTPIARCSYHVDSTGILRMEPEIEYDNTHIGQTSHDFLISVYFVKTDRYATDGINGIGLTGRPQYVKLQD